MSELLQDPGKSIIDIPTDDIDPYDDGPFPEWLASIDVSMYQPNIDWTTVCAGELPHRCMQPMIRATRVTDPPQIYEQDPLYAKHIVNCQEACDDTPCGSYHYLAVDANLNCADQADYYYSIVNKYMPSDGLIHPQAVQFEVNSPTAGCNGQLSGWTQCLVDFIDRYNNISSLVTPLSVYTSPSTWQYCFDINNEGTCSFIENSGATLWLVDLDGGGPPSAIRVLVITTGI